MKSLSTQTLCRYVTHINQYPGHHQYVHIRFKWLLTFGQWMSWLDDHPVRMHDRVTLFPFLISLFYFLILPLLLLFMFLILPLVIFVHTRRR